MKKAALVLTILSLVMALFLGGCVDMLMDEPNIPEEPGVSGEPGVSEEPDVSKLAEGEGLLVISLAGANVGVGPALTMLPLDPQFTRYELVYSSSSLLITDAVISFYDSTFQLPLAAASDYTFTVLGYGGDKVVAKSAPVSVTISAGNITPASFTLKPYMDVTSPNLNPGVLDFSLSWDGLSRMPYRAELLVEKYAEANGDLIDPPAELGQTLIPPEYRAGSVPGSILLLERDSAYVNLTGSLSLPPGEYRLTISVMMDPDTTPASRLDFAHIYSNLTTLAPFYYGGGDLYISNTSPDSGASFITGFTFTQTPNATTVIGSEPGLDGTRMIMIMVPYGTDLAALTPIVTCASGSFITSPLAADTSNPANYSPGEIDFTNPTIWTAQAKNGAVQKYTVVVSDAPDDSTDKRITYFFFDGHGNNPGIIDEAAHTIHVILPTGTIVTNLTPIISIIGKNVVRYDGGDYPVGAFNFTPHSSFGTPVVYRVYAEINTSTYQDYEVSVDVAPSNEAEITRFAIDGYPDRAVTGSTNSTTGFGNIAGTPDVGGYYPINLRLPYGVSLKNLTPVIQYKGESLAPLSGVPQNFSGPVYYTVTAENDDTRTYKVTITNEPPDKNTGIFDFKVTNVPTAKIVIGQKPRQDGRIPIVIQVPFGTNEQNMIAAITLSSPDAKIYNITNLMNPITGGIIPFGNAGNPKEAVYRVTAEDTTVTQDYVAVVSAGGQYYYVDGTNGNDTDPDYYNGETEGRPFKTLAHAVKEAAKPLSTISKIFILGDLTAENQKGAGTDTTLIESDSVVTIDGPSSKKITITSVNGSTIKNTESGKRVLEIKGGADLVFENINITGGNTTGDGGGIHISGNSKVKFSGGNITGNKASSGGGVYVEGDSATSFNFMSGEISGNTATGTASGYNSSNPNDPTALGNMDGGGGVYVKGNATFWLAPGGTISGNTTKGAGGGVLVNGTVSGSYYPGPATDEYGFIMSGGKIVNNTTTSSTYPHGGGGVYVAQGYFEMPGGEITGNTANRQGGGVFVHWGEARFNASGNSTITGNAGVGSSKAICNRGITELMGNARADKVYVWNYDGASVPDQQFTLTDKSQVTGIVLAYSDESGSNKNVITIASSFESSSVICTIDLESHLNGAGLFAGQLEPDWIGKTIVTGNNATLEKVLGITPTGPNRLPLNSFTGQPSVYNMGNNYKINVVGTEGKFAKKP